MNLGIVGSEASKFTGLTEATAKDLIEHLFEVWGATRVISGGCHLGGIDLWAIKMAFEKGLDVREYRPANLRWSTGYKLRNQQIAEESDVVICITVKSLPPTYKGMIFPLCYHCGTKEHVKSGGCWTVKYARSIGKEGRIFVIDWENWKEYVTC